MTTAAGPVAATRPEDAERSGDAAESRRYVRGSSLLLAGRFLSVLLNFAVQVLTVRYLAKGDYGAFAYALGVAALGSNVVLLGLGKGIPRLLPIYLERGDYARAFGSIVLAAATIWGVGLSAMAAVFLFQGPLARGAQIDARSLSLLLVLVALAPLDAFDHLLQNLVAVFCRARAIFLRRHVLGPVLKLSSILVVFLVSGDVYLLAAGYLLGSAIGVAAYVATLVRTWHRQGVLRHLRPGAWQLPAREVFGFSLPLVSTDLAVALRTSFMVIMLGYFWDAPAVADYRAVLPVAHLNMVVFEAFAFLFVPLASRMYARGDHDGIGQLYWRTSLWIAVLTFPVFAATCLLAPTLTLLFFGERYAGAASLLAILAAGHYVNAALGFNAATLRVHGKLRLIVAGDVLAVLGAVALGYVLVGRYGGVGAALATTATLILQNLFNHAGLLVGGTGVRLLEWRYLRVYALIALVSAALGAFQWLLHPPVALTVVVAAAACLGVIRASRRSVDPRGTFPELLRIPAVRWLLA